MHFLQSVPEEEAWLAGQLSPHTRRAYKRDLAHFVRTMHIRSADELRQVGRAAVIVWQNLMKERGRKPRTIRRRLSALSSLFAHLVANRAADTNPVCDIKRPRVNRRQGTTRAFSPKEARKILDVPDAATLIGLRDRAILSVGLQAGPRRSEIASLLVKDYHTNAGYKSLHFIRKGGEDLSLAINPQTALRRRLLEDMRLRNFSPHTEAAYVRAVAGFAGHFGRSAEDLTGDDARKYLLHLIQNRNASVSLDNIARCPCPAQRLCCMPARPPP